MATKGYRIDFTTNSIIMNYKFAAAASEYGTDEYNIVKGILSDYPTMTKVVKPGRTYTHSRANKNLTYIKMEEAIRSTKNEQLLSDFLYTIKMSKTQKSPYKYVRDWFIDVYSIIESEYPSFSVLPPEEKEIA